MISKFFDPFSARFGVVRKIDGKIKSAHCHTHTIPHHISFYPSTHPYIRRHLKWNRCLSMICEGITRDKEGRAISNAYLAGSADAVTSALRPEDSERGRRASGWYTVSDSHVVSCRLDFYLCLSALFGCIMIYLRKCTVLFLYRNT